MISISNRVVKLTELSYDVQKFNNAMELYNKNYPIMEKFCNPSGVSAIDFLEKIFIDKKKVIKYINAMNKLEDVHDYDMCLYNVKNYKNLIELLGYDKIMKILNTLQSNDMSFHDWQSNLPKINLDDNSEEVFEFLMRSFSYSLENCYKSMHYMNFKKIRFAKNLDEIIKHINYINACKVGIKKIIINDAYSQLSKLNKSSKISFTKDNLIIGTIGRETNCCFHSHGVASSLLQPAIKSPISGIIHGNIGRNRWFSFVWEMVEILNGNVYKTLILDNIESNGRITDGSAIWEALDRLNYKSIYCGTSRNDIDFPEEVKNIPIKSKPYNLVGYESNFAKYGSYDDSKELYTLKSKPTDSVAYIRRMNYGDLHRVKYLENYIWGSNNDDEFLDIDVKNSPSFIIESSTNIYGYFTTRLKYYHSYETSYTQNGDIKSKDLKNIIKENENNNLPKYNGITKVLYLEDIFIIKHRNCIASLKPMIEYLIEWAKDNDIKIVSANTNQFSEPFIKRVKDAGFIYVEQDDMSSYSPSRTIEATEFNKPSTVINDINSNPFRKDLYHFETEGDELDG